MVQLHRCAISRIFFLSVGNNNFRDKRNYYSVPANTENNYQEVRNGSLFRFDTWAHYFSGCYLSMRKMQHRDTRLLLSVTCYIQTIKLDLIKKNLMGMNGYFIRSIRVTCFCSDYQS